MYQLIEKLIKKKAEIINSYLDMYESGKGGVFVYFNQNSFNNFYKNPPLIELTNEFMFYQEGIGLYILLKLFNKWEFERIDSTEIHENFISILIQKKNSVVFVGGDFNKEEFLLRCRKKKLLVEAVFNGFSDIENRDYLIKKIKICNSRYIFLGLGTPKQELLAFELKKYLPDRVFICVGNFMNFFLNYQRRAPKILRKLNLEWFFRFLLEPRRLFNRYIIGGPLFFFRILYLKFNPRQ